MNNNSSNNNLSGKHHFSIVLSFAVAMFAIISLIAVGFNQISFAAPNDGTSSSDKFTLSKYELSATGQQPRPVKISLFKSGLYLPIELMFTDNATLNVNTEVVTQGDAFKQYVQSTDFKNFIKGKHYVFCIDKSTDFPGYGSEYTRKDRINDGGIAYILSRSGIYSSGNSIIPAGTGGDYYEVFEAYATQLAIWLLNEDEGTLAKYDIITGADSIGIASTDGNYDLPIITDQGTVKTITDNILSVVEKAKAARIDGFNPTSIKIDCAEDISDVDGTNYYQSSLVQVTPTPNSNFVSYDLTLSGIEGIFPVNENGEEIKNLSNLTASDKFYIRIPKDKVGDGTNEITIGAVGKFSNVTLPYRYYLADDKQDLVGLGVGDDTPKDEKKLVVVSSPDTGASTSQTIYFIGLVVLLCGVGIIYANSKAIKNV